MAVQVDTKELGVSWWIDCSVVHSDLVVQLRVLFQCEHHVSCLCCIYTLMILFTPIQRFISCRLHWFLCNVYKMVALRFFEDIYSWFTDWGEYGSIICILYCISSRLQPLGCWRKYSIEWVRWLCPMALPVLLEVILKCRLRLSHTVVCLIKN